MIARTYPRVLTGAALIGFVAAVNIPYTMLVELFGYDDVLREPPALVLERFRAGGDRLVLAWLGFAAAALLFAPLSRAVERMVGMTPGWLGPASAVAQFVGLARWAFIVPALAAAHAAAPDAGARRAVETLYLVQHQMLGTAIGEVLGQVLLIGWTCRMVVHLWRDHPTLSYIGALTLPLWLVGLTEPLATVLPRLPVIEATPFAFMGWEAWLLAIGVTAIAAGRRFASVRG